MIRKIPHRTDYLMTQEQALTPLQEQAVKVTWFTNANNRESVMHQHTHYYEMVLPIAGEVLYSVEGSLCHLHNGELILFPLGMYHRGKFDVVPGKSERLVVKIDVDLWNQAIHVAKLDEAVWPRQVTIMDADAVAYWDMRRLFERMSYTAGIHPDHQQTVFLSQMVECLCIFDHVVRRQHTSVPSATSRQVQQAVEYIRQNYCNPNLSVAELAEHTYTSRGYLCRIFKEYTMESVYNYITVLRMQHCRQSLADKDKSILEACNESGFSDYTSFLKTFRRMYGITPSQYKKMLHVGSEEAAGEEKEEKDLDALTES